MKELNVFFNSSLVGILRENEEERLEFQYSSEWLKNVKSFPLSLNLNLTHDKYEHLQTKAFFENLIPEGDVKKILVDHSHGNIEDEFNFLRKYGEDCAGAFIITELDLVKYKKSKKPATKHLSLKKIYNYISKRANLADVMVNKEGAKFSLAGAQDKFPIIFKDGKIYLVLDKSPSSHILKPPVRLTDVTKSSPYNEFFCMSLAKKTGLNVPNVELIIGEHPLYLIERFDRIISNNNISRIHSYDFCQAKGLTSKKKYQTDGGPTFADHYRLVSKNVNNPVRDLRQLLMWLWFNLFVGNNDCHAKNLSFVQKNNHLELSPFYDILSISVYARAGYRKEFSYKIGGQWHWHKMSFGNFKMLAKECNISTSLLLKEGEQLHRKLSEILPVHFDKLHGQHQEYLYKSLRTDIKKRLNHFKMNVFDREK